MVKLKVKQTKNGVLIRMKLSAEEEISPRELERLQAKSIPWLMSVQTVNRTTLDFTSPYSRSLAQHLARPVGEFEFLRIMSQAVDTVIRTHREGLSLNNLELDLRYVFYSDADVELNFLYLPVLRNHVYVDVRGFLDALLMSMKADSRETAESIEKFRVFLRRQAAFDARSVMEYLDGEMKTLQKRKSVQRVRGDSGFITDKPRDYYEHYHGRETAADTGGMARGRSAAPNVGGMARGRSAADTGGMGRGRNPAPNAGGMARGGEDSTTVLHDGDPWAASEEATTVLGADDTQEEAATTVLREAGEPREPEVHYAALQRMGTGESIELNKPVFRLGKERSYVDYFIGNNNFVSRSHADIITRNGRYFIKDLNSKNGTYIRGTRLPPNIETELRNGDSILLADEEFVLWT